MSFREWFSDFGLSWNNGAEGKVTKKASSPSLSAHAASAAFLPPSPCSSDGLRKKALFSEPAEGVVCHLTAASIAQCRVARPCSSCALDVAYHVVWNHMIQF